jgi:Subtilase family
MGGRMASCLTILAASGLIGCIDAPTQQPDTVPALTVGATDSVALTYICGNMFRIRNSSFDPRSVRWDIYNANPADTGSLWARGRDVGRTSVDFFVTSRTKGTMRLFVGTTLVATKANGNKVACVAPVDTSPLPVNPSAGAASARVVVESPSVSSPTGDAYRRTAVNVRFNGTATSAEVRAFQTQFSAQLIAVYPSFFRFRVRDPGSEYSQFTSMMSAMALHASVLSATPIHSFDRVRNFGARYPNDGAGHRRNDYIAQAFSTWPARSMRLPQAWWCETGRYGGTIPRIVMYEQNFPIISAADVARSITSPVTRITKWRDTMVSPPNDSNRVEFQNHGHFIAGLLTASGDDSVGLAGPLWRSDLRVITLGNTDKASGAGSLFFSAYVGPEIRSIAPRILTLSSDISARTGTTQADTVERDGQFFDALLSFRTLLDSLPNLLIVQAVGNDAYQGQYSARDAVSRAVLQEGLVRLRNESSAYANRIVFVGETDVNENRASESNEFAGLVDIYAPGFDVPILLPSGAIITGRGTSFAAPSVAGIGGQLLAMDASLSASDLKALLLEGARDSVENSNGDNVAPSPVGNTTDVVYEADAYGSLRLLSALGGGRPLCGATVDAVRAQPAAPGEDHLHFSVVAQFYGGTSEVLGSTDSAGDSLLYPGTPFGTQLSVAPGARSFSVTSVTPLEESRANMFRLQNRVWTAADRIDGSYGVLFGERDTLLLSLGGAVFATAGSGRLPIAPIPNSGSGSGFLPGGFSFAPDGSAYTVTADYAEIAAPNDVRIVRRSGTTTALQGSPTLYGSVRTAWLPDSRSIIVSRVRELNSAGTILESTLTRLSVGSTSLPVQQQGIVATGGNTGVAALGSSDEGGRILFRISGPFYTITAEVDCSIKSVRTGTLNDVRVVRQLRPGVCGASTPPGGGGGQEGRVARPADAVSLSINNGAAPRALALSLRERKGQG